MRSADPERWDEEVSALQEAGIDGLHLDVMDGLFVSEACFVADDVGRLRRAGARFVDVHLLVEDPVAWADGFLEAGCDRLSFHLECLRNPRPLLERIRAAGVKAGLVVLPGTPLEQLGPWLDAVDLVNPLGVDPTRGTGFDESTFARVQALVRQRTEGGFAFVVQGDGGVWEKTRDDFVRAGAEELVGGYPIFSSDDYAAAVEALRHGGPGPKE